MTISKTSFKEYSFAHHGAVYAILEKVFATYGIPYYLIGANARDVHLYQQGIRPNRGTADIDFAVMVPDFDTYKAIFEALSNLGFKPTKEPYRLVYNATNTVLDLMPYGEIAQEYTVNFTERNLELSVLGLKEVGAFTQQISIPEEGYTLPVSPIEGIFILKLVAWQDKPTIRTKDLEDISFLLQHAWDLYEEEAYSEHPDIFEDENFDTQTAAAKVIGKKMGLILVTNKTLCQVVTGILENISTEDEIAKNPEITVAQSLNITLEKAKSILNYILEGIYITSK